MLSQALLTCLNPLPAAVPTLDHLHPISVQSGTTGLVTFVGKFEPWPPKVWADDPGLSFLPTTNTGQITVVVSNSATPGPHLVRVFNEEGASGPRFLLVAASAELAEREPNDDYANPQMIEALPAVVNGRLEKPGDVDSYGVELQTAQSLIASVEAYVLASPLDAVLRVLDPRGVQVALNHDDGRTLDPFVAFTAPSAGRYVVQVFGFPYPADSDVRLTGNARCVYRLHLSRGPFVKHTLPLGVTRGQRSRLQGLGWNLGPTPIRLPEFDGTTIPTNALVIRWRPDGVENELTLPVGQGMEQMEQEPNDQPADAGALTVPGAVTGRLDRPDDVDRYRFAARKGEDWHFEIQSASLGFPVDAWLRIEDASGKELKNVDDAAGVDPVLDWAAPADGSFIAAVGSVVHRGGPDHYYRLAISRPAPAVKAVSAVNALTVEAGRTNELKFSVSLLHGAKAPARLVINGLPDGVKALSGDVPEKGGEVVVKWVAAPDVKSFSGPVRMLLRDPVGGAEQPVVSELITSGVDNGVPNGFQHLVIETVDSFWLTVRAAKPVAAASAK